MPDTLVDRCLRKCLRGIPLRKEEITSLLMLPVGSSGDLALRRAARIAAGEITKNHGCIWCAVGMDYAPCSMNCKFCSFGAKWGIVQESRHVSEEEILCRARAYVEAGAAYIILRTTEFYDLETLLETVPRIRHAIPGDYGIVLNTGELDDRTARMAAEAGVYGAYHALRLREGQDTPFDPLRRSATMQSISDSGMMLISLVEPLGYEHTYEEIADRFLNAVACGVEMCGVMARFPVPGTPLGNMERIDDEYIAHVVAALRLSGGRSVRDLCVHPASPAAMAAGANVLVVESGAIPRDRVFSDTDWAGQDMERAKALLTGAGYRVSPPPARRGTGQSCCGGSEAERFLRPLLLRALRDGEADEAVLLDRLTGKKVAPARLRQELAALSGRGLLRKTGKRYALTESGRSALQRWQETVRTEAEAYRRMSRELE